MIDWQSADGYRVRVVDSRAERFGIDHPDMVIDIDDERAYQFVADSPTVEVANAGYAAALVDGVPAAEDGHIVLECGVFLVFVGRLDVSVGVEIASVSPGVCWAASEGPCWVAVAKRDGQPWLELEGVAGGRVDLIGDAGQRLVVEPATPAPLDREDDVSGTEGQTWSSYGP